MATRLEEDTEFYRFKERLSSNRADKSPALTSLPQEGILPTGCLLLLLYSLSRRASFLRLLPVGDGDEIMPLIGVGEFGNAGELQMKNAPVPGGPVAGSPAGMDQERAHEQHVA